MDKVFEYDAGNIVEDSIEPADLLLLGQAVKQLESSGLATSISQIIGIPVEKAMAALPGHWATVVSKLTHKAISKALDMALFSLDSNPCLPSNKLHCMLAGMSGAAGGAMGVTALAIELPLSATIMLRSIADTARSYGENLQEIDTQLACLSVFAFSGRVESERSSKESADTSYYAVRSFLSKSLGDAAQQISLYGISKESGPALVRLVHAVSLKFSVPVTEKLLVQSLPIVGAAGGASVNLIFIRHYQKMAAAHFLIRSLERKYGESRVKSLYDQIVQEKAI
jgi:hypothetical protein